MKRALKIYILLLFVFSISACGVLNSKTRPQSDLDLKEAAKINVKLASGYIQRGDLEVAKVKLLKAIEQDDEYVPAYTTMAILMGLVGEPDEADDYYQKALDIDNKNPETLNNYGAFLCNQNKVDEAIEQFNKVIRNQFYETPEKSHANLGYCLMKAKNPDYVTAEKHLRLALKSRPTMPSALLAMGELGIETRRYMMTRAYMQRFHAVSQPTASSLWYQIQAEKALGDQKHFIELSRELLKRFPSSVEAEKVMDLSDR
ncbi:MAG: type IV pilus biogenesis/stability protein PilW [Gammaproteobacteria bacterium]|nr:type IV pilus biogenesis/stability protein PilW [Gammaproteobacteria bacterium]